MTLLVSLVFWLVSLFGVDPSNDSMMTVGWYPTNGPQAVFNVDSYVTISGQQKTADSDPNGALHTCMVYASLINFTDGSHGLLVERDCSSWEYCRLSFYRVNVP